MSGTALDVRCSPATDGRRPRPTDGRAGAPVVLVSTEDEVGWRRAAAEAAAEAGAYWLDLVLAPGTGVRLGPLSHAGWPACTVCAQRRMDAARTGGAVAAGRQDGLGSLVELAEALLVRESPGLAPDRRDRSPLRGHLLTLDPTGHDLTRHGVVGIPGCPLCLGAGPARRPEPLPTDDLGGLLERLDGWLDPLTGVLPAVRLDHPYGTGPGTPTIATVAAPHVYDGEVLRELPGGWGKGVGDGPALLSAVGEAVERYAASCPEAARLVEAPAGELPGDRLDFGEFPAYRDDQYARPGFPYVRWDDGRPQPWVRGHWYGAERPVWVPAVLVYLRLGLRLSQLVVQGSSNGLAAGADRADAADRAVLELLERDALLTAWRTGGCVRAVDPCSVPADSARLVEALRHAGMTVRLGLVETSVAVPTVLALAHGDGRRTPGSCLGLAAATDPAAALRGALLELTQTTSYLTELLGRDRLAVPRAPEEVLTMPDHADYFVPAERRRWFDRLFRADAPVALGELASADATPLPERLAARGVRVAVVDVTPADVATGPFRVVRAVSPDLTPVTFGFGLDRRRPARRPPLPPPRSPEPPVHPIW